MLPSEVEMIGEAVNHLDDPATYDKLSVFMDHMVTAERIRADALVCAPLITRERHVQDEREIVL